MHAIRPSLEKFSPTLKRCGRSVLLAVGIGAIVSACAGEPSLTVKCPEIKVPQNTERLTRFQQGAGRDITDIRLQSEVTYLSGTCEVDEETIKMTFPVAVAGQRGPANTEGRSNISIFVAVTDQDRTILSRQELPMNLRFPGNKVRVIGQEELAVDIPRKAKDAPRDYLVFLGFVLSPAELDYNRNEDRLGYR